MSNTFPNLDGRPSKYREEMLPKIVDLMKDGASLIEVEAMLGISGETLYDWCDKKSPRYKPKFSEAVNEGVRLSYAWWEHEGRTALRDKDFSYTGWYMNMKNRFGWRDRNETDLTSGGEKIQFANIVPRPEDGKDR